MKMLPLSLLAVGLILVLAACISPVKTTPIPAVETGVDPESWSLIPGGDYVIGQHELPITLENGYEMMVTTVTNEQYARFLNEALKDGEIQLQDGDLVGYYPGDEYHGHKHEEEIKAGNYKLAEMDDPGMRIVGENEYIPVAGYANHPVTMVTWFGARAYCDFYGWRLPVENEWEIAARGEGNRPFPWGDEIQPTNANYYSSHDIFEKTLGGAGDTTPVGFYNGQNHEGFQTVDSPSPYGLYDMAGNVWQWTGNVYQDQHYRYLRGGSQENYAYNLRVWTRNSAGPSYFSPNVGFRCARDVETP